MSIFICARSGIIEIELTLLPDLLGEAMEGGRGRTFGLHSTLLLLLSR